MCCHKTKVLFPYTNFHSICCQDKKTQQNSLSLVMQSRENNKRSSFITFKFNFFVTFVDLPQKIVKFLSLALLIIQMNSDVILHNIQSVVC